MSLANTTLSGNVTLGQQTVKLTTYTAPPAGIIAIPKYVRVDGEWMLIADDALAPTLRVVRGVLATNAVAHSNGAACAYGIATDITPTNVVGGYPGSLSQQIASYNANGPIAIPSLPINVEQQVYITKPGVAALTLAAPPLDMDGLTLLITSNTAFAHTITATGLFNTGTAAVNLATFAARAGATLGIQAASGLWNVISLQNVAMT
jgi:hypothetical protein